MFRQKIEPQNLVLAYDEEKVEQCCSEKSAYEITYNHISKTWFVCSECSELKFFKTGIKEKVRIQR